MSRAVRGTVVVVALSMLIAGALWLGGAGRSEPESVSVRQSALTVWQRWDAQRARAWALGDIDGLAKLYAPGSGAGRRDVAHLRAWKHRGWVVVGMTRRIESFEVLSSGPTRLRVRLRDRMVGALAQRADNASQAPARRLPEGTTTTRVVLLSQSAGRWQVSGVRAAQ